MGTVPGPVRYTQAMSAPPIPSEPFTGWSPTTVPGPWRQADYWALPESAPVELLRGQFSMSPSPSPLHQICAYLLYERLSAAVRTVGGLVLGAPLDVVLADDTVVQPDLLYVSPARRASVQDRVIGPPDLVVEVVSPASVARDRVQKLSLYLQYGVPEYWIIDPASQMIEFLVRRDAEYAVALPQGDQYRSRLCCELCLDLPAYWAEVAARLGERTGGV